MSDWKLTDEQKVALYQIATEMKAAGLADELIAPAVDMAHHYEGTLDLMTTWAESKETELREQCIADLQDSVDEWLDRPRRVVERPKIPFEELADVAAKVLDFKTRLRNKVDAWGGINKLARVTGIPQPSLSRMFSSASLPRRTTLYRIANAIGLPETEIVFDWTK